LFAAAAGFPSSSSSSLIRAQTMEQRRRLLLEKTGAPAEVRARALVILEWTRFSLRSDVPGMSPDEYYLGMTAYLRDDPDAAKLAMAVLSAELDGRTRVARVDEMEVMRTVGIMVGMAPDRAGLRQMVDAAMESRAIASALVESKEE
jgi:hypothetical protein